MAEVYIAKTDVCKYPEHDFNPDTQYPEYPFGNNLNAEQNVAYDLVRKCLYGLNYDRENYGTPHWNPLGHLIEKGNTVVIKPNLVMHKNGNSNITQDAMECLITHPSCIRAICDYCVIALNGTGRIIIADAPMQGCNFRELVKKMHLDELINFYEDKGIAVELLDLRQYQAEFNRNKVITHKEYTSSRGVIVHMGEKSAHVGSGCNQQYQVSDYSKEETMQHHHDNVHDYEIAETILQADVIINFCKPKTHRLAGITAAMKNMVGVTYNKATLPHRTAGSISEGGDAYQHKSRLKRAADWALTQKIKAENSHSLKIATLYRFVYGAFLVAGRKLAKDTYYIGSWYGNDTIWRTVVDLNYIVKYADQQGHLQDTPQRKLLHLGDMIIAGERNGPVSPEPKKLGVILASEDAAAFDITFCRLMGLPYEKIPMCRSICDNKTFICWKEPELVSNFSQINGRLCDISFPETWKFRLHDAWKESMEIQSRRSTVTEK